MMDTEFDLAICLIIKTDEKIESISKIMEIVPSGSIIKGQSRFDFLPKVNENIWVLRKRYKQQSDIGTSMRDFLGGIPEFEKKIQEVNKHGICTLRISIVSLWGQIAFSLSPDELHLLSKLGIPFEVSIFSYGNCTVNR